MKEAAEVPKNLGRLRHESSEPSSTVSCLAATSDRGSRDGSCTANVPTVLARRPDLRLLRPDLPGRRGRFRSGGLPGRIRVRRPTSGGLPSRRSASGGLRFRHSASAGLPRRFRTGSAAAAAAAATAAAATAATVVATAATTIAAAATVVATAATLVTAALTLDLVLVVLGLIVAVPGCSRCCSCWLFIPLPFLLLRACLLPLGLLPLLLAADSCCC